MVPLSESAHETTQRVGIQIPSARLSRPEQDLTYREGKIGHGGPILLVSILLAYNEDIADRVSHLTLKKQEE